MMSMWLRVVASLSMIWGLAASVPTGFLATACGVIQVAPVVNLGAVRTDQWGLWGTEVRNWSEPNEGRTDPKT